MNQRVVRPVRWKYSEWIARCRDLDARRRRMPKIGSDCQPLIQVVSEWAQEVEKDYSALDLDRQWDIVNLLKTELETLWELIDPITKQSKNYPKSPTERDRLEFRERWFDATTLLVIIIRLGFPNVGALKREADALEAFATRRRKWLL